MTGRAPPLPTPIPLINYLPEEQYNLTDVLRAVSGTPSHSIVELVSRSTLDADGLEELIGALRHGAYFLEPDLKQLVGWWIEYRASTALQDRNVGGFLRYLLRVQQTRPDQPGIRLTTPHRSKGLEFHAVAVVGLTQGAFPDYRSLRDKEAIEAERRAFYVSITRASRALLLTPNPPMRSGLGVGTRGEGRGMRRSALDSDRWGRWRPLVVVGGADGGPGQRRWGGVGGTACMGRQSRTGPMRLYGEVG